MNIDDNPPPVSEQPEPVFTGPAGDRRCYRIADPRSPGRGGLGVVFRATLVSERLGAGAVGAEVGLKMLTGMDDVRWEKLLERSPKLTELVHPHLATHLEVFSGPPPSATEAAPDEPDQRYSAHVWVEGETLAERSGAAGIDALLRWIGEVGAALDYLHAHPAGPFAHRDVHPRNVIITPAGQGVLIDYDTVFAGDTWTTTRLLRGSRFASPGGLGPAADDRLALAKVALHTLAGDGDGALDDSEVALRLRSRVAGVANPEELVATLLTAQTTDPGSCAVLTHRLDRAAHRRPNLGCRLTTRLISRLPSGRPAAALVAAAVFLTVLLVGGIASQSPDLRAAFGLDRRPTPFSAGNLPGPTSATDAAVEAHGTPQAARGASLGTGAAKGGRMPGTLSPTPKRSGPSLGQEQQLAASSLPPGTPATPIGSGSVPGSLPAGGSPSPSGFPTPVPDAAPTPTPSPAGPAPTFTLDPVPNAHGGADGIVAGRDGNLWFSGDGGNVIGRITTGGSDAEFSLAAGSAPAALTAGPDGNVWFAELLSNKIGRITPSGVLTEFPIPRNNSQPSGITSGPDGNLWFTEYAGYIGRVTPAGVFSEFPVPNINGSTNSSPTGIVAGPDGNLWFTEYGTSAIGRISTVGVLTQYSVSTRVTSLGGIAVGSDGNLWFADSGSNSIGRISTMGVITEFPITAADAQPGSIVNGPDGALWFSETQSGNVGRITTTGIVAEYPLPAQFGDPRGLTWGPDGRLWITLFTSNLAVMRIP